MTEAIAAIAAIHTIAWDSGSGHTTTVIGDEDVRHAIVQLLEKPQPVGVSALMEATGSGPSAAFQAKASAWLNGHDPASRNRKATPPLAPRWSFSTEAQASAGSARRTV
jgi:hypothetical protein